ncbi:DinB family protein [Enemella evansiae]|uniref:DinB family protein n=1 Tax=Enemella evansiae TaxID=2016499 RepID=UPI000B978A2E|nr:DinB family protein [Enemella evansiae]OYO03467.1 hypothetical protein CGZ97_08430 [Enemella evansiae]
MTDPTALDAERRMLLQTLADRRRFLIGTAEGLTDDQARQAATVSDLTIGGIIKHVAATERSWIDFVLDGPDPSVDFMAMEKIDWNDPSTIPAWVLERQDEFTLRADQTLSEILAGYAEVAARTEQVVTELADLGVSHQLPAAPWDPDPGQRSAREVLAHLIGETAQHAGHADVIREAIDGKKSMA